MQYPFPSKNAVALALLLLTAALPASAQVREGSVATPRPTATADDGPDYLIGAEDVLDIAVWNSTELSRTVPVRPDGKISLPLVNDIRAAGLTPMQLRDHLVAALAPYIPDPTVSVIVRDIQSQKITVMGEVKTPGRYTLRSRATVLDALAMAGGFTEYASRGRILVLRRRGETTYQVPFAYNRVADGSEKGNFDLEPGDIVVVP